MEITCPSGLSGVIRGLTVREAEILTDRRAIREATVVDDLLKAGWIEALDSGPYDIDVDGTIDWGRVLIGDRSYIILQLRIKTYGPEYDFDVGCSSCTEPIKWSLDLTDLPIQRYDSDDLTIWKEKGNRFHTEIRDSNDRMVSITYQLMDGNLERRTQKGLRASKNKLVTSLAAKIIDVDGYKNKMAFLRSLPLDSAWELLDRMDEHDGGIETDVEVICDSCGSLTMVNLPFARPEFWAPRKRGKRPSL